MNKYYYNQTYTHLDTACILHIGLVWGVPKAIAATSVLVVDDQEKSLKL
jgi:hypothetical protein